jgi:uncharacterized protein YcfL
MKKLFIYSMILGLLSSCATNKIKDHLEVVGDGDLGDIAIKDMRSQQINGKLMAQGTFKNNSSKPTNAYYRCKFLDATGFQVGEDQVWQLVTLYGNGSSAFKCQATDYNAVNFKIEFSSSENNVTVYK